MTLGLKKRGFKIGVDGGGKETKKPMKINNYQEPAGEGNVSQVLMGLCKRYLGSYMWCFILHLLIH